MPGPVPVAPTLAVTTQAIASHCTGVSNSSSSTIAASAAAAGSRLIRMPKSRGVIRRSAVSSKLYGITEQSRPTARPSSSTRGSSSTAPASRIGRRREHHGTDQAGDRQPGDARPVPAGLRAEQDVARPAAARPAGRTNPGQVRLAGDSPSSATPSPASADPDQVPRPAGPDHGDRQRTEELDGHRDAQRDPGERLVDRPVHGHQADPETEGDQPVPPAAAAYAGPGDDQEHHRRGDQAQPDHRRRRHDGEQVLGDRRPELDRDDASRAPARRPESRCTAATVFQVYPGNPHEPAKLVGRGAGLPGLLGKPRDRRLPALPRPGASAPMVPGPQVRAIWQDSPAARRPAARPDPR